MKNDTTTERDSTPNRRQFITQTLATGASLAMLGGFGTTARANTQKAPQPAAGKANPNGRFAGKVVLITGATSGIGEATARAFAMEGAKVFFNGRRENLGKKLEAEIRERGGDATYMKSDVRHEEQVRAFVEGCIEKYKRIDIAFNNAGTIAPPKPIAEFSLDDWQNVIATNATGVLLSMKYEIAQMLKQGGGVIVNNASVSAHVGFATIAAYSASKHAVHSLTKVAALENSAKNIRINCVSPEPSIRRCCAQLWKRGRLTSRPSQKSIRSAGSCSRRKLHALSCISAPTTPRASRAPISISLEVTLPNEEDLFHHRRVQRLRPLSCRSSIAARRLRCSDGPSSCRP
jgi:NAD(P)-dependent dehydrogenase (short-subunit alcohol dehydrogenase family)